MQADRTQGVDYQADRSDADHADPTDALVQVLDDWADAEVLVATTEARRADLWRWRERHTECIATLGTVHKLDVTLPAAELAGFVARVHGEVAGLAPAARTWIFGHVADGNLHVNVTGLDDADEGLGDAVDGAVLGLVAALGGSISAEHGIGTMKARWLHLNRSPAEVAAMRALKTALDPHGVLNPAVLFAPS